jgi:hypothetical protein
MNRIEKEPSRFADPYQVLAYNNKWISWALFAFKFFKSLKIVS